MRTCLLKTCTVMRSKKLPTCGSSWLLRSSVSYSRSRMPVKVRLKAPSCSNSKTRVANCKQQAHLGVSMLLSLHYGTGCLSSACFDSRHPNCDPSKEI